MWYSSFTTRYYVFVVSIAPIGHQRRLKLLCEDLVEIRGLLRYKTAPALPALRRPIHPKMYTYSEQIYCIILGAVVQSETLFGCYFCT